MKHTFLNKIEFAEDTHNNLPWIDAFKIGDWHDGRYDVTKIDGDYLDSIVKNFNDNVRNVEIAVDYNHGQDKAKGDKAAGWIRSVRRVGDKIQAAIEFTEEAAKEVKDKQWRYFSPQFVDEYTHSDGGEKYGPTMLLGSLTNTPVFKGISPINFSEAVLDAELTLIPEDTVVVTPPPTKTTKEDTVDEAQLRQLLGIGEDASIEDAVKALQTDAKSFSELRKKAESAKTFAEQFPEQYKRNQELEERVVKAEAKEFAESLHKPIVDKEGKKSKVLPPVVTEKIESVYKEFAEGHGSLANFKDVLDTIRTAGVVDLSESGSGIDNGGEDKPNTDLVKAFSEKMGDIMRKEKINPHEAMQKAADENPELYQAYLEREIPVK